MGEEEPELTEKQRQILMAFLSDKQLVALVLGALKRALHAECQITDKEESGE